jgi:hypothetical protein
MVQQDCACSDWQVSMEFRNFICWIYHRNDIYRFVTMLHKQKTTKCFGNKLRSCKLDPTALQLTEESRQQPWVFWQVTQSVNQLGYLSHMESNNRNRSQSFVTPASVNYSHYCVPSADTKKQTNSVALSPRTNYADWATATCRRVLIPYRENLFIWRRAGATVSLTLFLFLTTLSVKYLVIHISRLKVWRC